MGKTVVKPRPNRRLTGKTSFKVTPQSAVVGSVLASEPDAKEARQKLAPKKVYLVTFPHPKQKRSKDGYPLKAPGSMTKSQVLDRLLGACQSPVYLDAKNIHACPPVPVRLTGVWRELHKETDSCPAHPHDHAPLLAHRSFRPWAVKRALLRKYGLATHWSFSHDGYWSCLKYLVLLLVILPVLLLSLHLVRYYRSMQHVYQSTVGGRNPAPLINAYDRHPSTPSLILASGVVNTLGVVPFPKSCTTSLCSTRKLPTALNINIKHGATGF